MTSSDHSNGSDALSAHVPADAELIDEIVIAEDIIDDDGLVIGEHIETIDVFDVDGEGVVVVDDVTIITDDEGDLLIDETVAVFDEEGDVMIDETVTVVDAEGDVLITERVIATDAAGDVLVDETVTMIDADGDVVSEEHMVLSDAEGDVITIDAITVVDSEEVDERLLADGLRQELDDVEYALGRLDAGTYGICESCGNRIEDSVLAETPQARRCGAHLL